jgi:hypothetical protein
MKMLLRLIDVKTSNSNEDKSFVINGVLNVQMLSSNTTKFDLVLIEIFQDRLARLLRIAENQNLP